MFNIQREKAFYRGGSVSRARSRRSRGSEKGNEKVDTRFGDEKLDRLSTFFFKLQGEKSAIAGGGELPAITAFWKSNLKREREI
jgi:hypothetical protein